MSVVIASHDSAGAISECLLALESQEDLEKAEVIVVHSSSDGTGDLVSQRFPWVRLLTFSDSLTTPYLRGEGILVARGNVLALIDPYCIVDKGWLAELIKVHNIRPEVAIGGSVEPARPGELSMVGWATYFWEYGAFMLPLDEGPALELTGNNVSYKLRSTPGLKELKSNGFWKTFTNRELLAEGHQLWTDPRLIVQLHKKLMFWEFFCSRYHHGRCFAAMRVSASPRSQAVLYAVVAPLLPCLALARHLKSVWPKGHNRRKFLMTLPMILLFNVSWAWGELVGYLRGPGRSCAELFY